MGQIATVTIGSDSFSVYALTASAAADEKSYFNGQMSTSASNVAFLAASSSDRLRALQVAADWMDRALVWSGTPSAPGQPRAWPRDGATDNGVSLPAASVPDKLAQCEFYLAGLILQDPSTSDSPGQGTNIKGVGAGPAHVDFFTPTIFNPEFNTPLPKPAMDIVKGLFGSTIGIQTAFTSGQVDEDGNEIESHFEEDDFERNQGFS